MISFSIAFRKEFELTDLIELAKLTAKLCKPVKFQLEYTVGLKDGVYSKETVYLEKSFYSFDDFEAFFNSSKFRFDSLKLLQEEADDHHYHHLVSFSQNQGTLGVFGNQEDIAVVENIVKQLGKDILYAYTHDYLDLSLSRINRYRAWTRKLGEIPDYVRYYGNPRYGSGERDKYLIDLESVPTHQHLNVTEDDLWFGACAVMYFSDIYYDQIPKEKWDEFTACESNVVLESGLRKITLYDDFADFENAENRDKQWQFRQQLNIDTVAHKLLGSPFSPKGMVKLIEAEEAWLSVKDALDALQVASGQTFGKKKLREIVAQLVNDKIMIVKTEESIITLKSQEDLQSLINTYDPQIVISKIL